MTNINVNLKDSKGSPLVGTIRVKLDYIVVDDTDNSAYLPVAATATLTNGQATLNLEPSETARVTYLFEVTQTTTVDGVTTDTIVWSFRAKVPDSTTAIALADLIQTTGITNDALDSSLTAVVRRLYNSSDFWARLQSEVFKPKGSYSSSAWYKQGDLVNYQGSSYLFKSPVSAQGQTPTNTTYWQLLAAIGNTGAGTTGNNSVYDATGWDNQTDAPSRNAVRDIIEALATKTALATKADITNAALTNPTLTADPTGSDRSSKIVSSQWVQGLLDVVKKALVPVGTIANYAGSSAPTGWVLCDGRTLSRTTYADLFAMLGTTYNTGGEAGTDFRVPDLRGRVAVGLDNMSATTGAANRIASLTALGLSGGAATHTLTVNEIPSHTHTFEGQNAAVNLTPGSNPYSVSPTGASVNSGSTGSGQAHNNLQPYLGLNAIIYAGV